MLTPEQTHKLIDDGVQQVLLKCGVGIKTSTTFLECLLYANTMIGEAMQNGTHNDPTIRSAIRDKLTQQAAGLLFLALQCHCDELYTNQELQRKLHFTQAPERAVLLEHGFMLTETQNAFNACFDAARTGQPFDEAAWARLRGGIQKLGAKV